jgi:amino acid transporter
MADAAIANLFVDTLSTFAPALKEHGYRESVLFLVFGGIAILNVRGVKQGIAFVQILTMAKLLPLLLLVIVGLFFVKGENLIITEWPSLTNLGEVCIILFFAFGGIEASLNASGEIKDPMRTVPRGIMLGVFTVLLVYLGIQFVAQGVLGAELVNFEETPLSEVASRVMGGAGATLLLAGAAISCFGLVSGDILATSRLPYAAARRGLLPAVMAKVHPRYATPYISVIVYSTIGFLASVSGGFRQMAAMSSSALLLVYLGVILSTIKLRKSNPNEKSFKTPGGFAIPILAIVAVVWFLSNLAMKELLAVVIYLGFFAVVYMIMNAIKKK